MNTFVNGFRCAKKNDNSEFILTLIQNFPTFDDTGNITENGKEIVGSFVMSPKDARRLADSIYSVFPPESEVEE